MVAREERVRRQRDEHDKQRKQRILNQLDHFNNNKNNNDNNGTQLTNDSSTTPTSDIDDKQNIANSIEDENDDIAAEIAAQIAEEKRYEEEMKRARDRRMVHNRRAHVDLPFFLWVPAFHRMHTLGLLMDPNYRQRHRLPSTLLSSLNGRGNNGGGNASSSSNEAYWGEAHAALFEQRSEEARAHGLTPIDNHTNSNNRGAGDLHAGSNNGISHQRIRAAAPGLHRRKQLAGRMALLQQKLVNRHIADTAALAPARPELAKGISAIVSLFISSSFLVRLMVMYVYDMRG
jgi:hypothetical protein